LAAQNKEKPSTAFCKLCFKNKWDRSKLGRFVRSIVFKIGYSECRFCIYCHKKDGGHRSLDESVLLQHGYCEFSGGVNGMPSKRIDYENLRKLKRCPGFTCVLYNILGDPIHDDIVKAIRTKRSDVLVVVLGWVVAFFIAFFALYFK
jgi:hypothetical protein